MELFAIKTKKKSKIFNNQIIPFSLDKKKYNHFKDINYNDKINLENIIQNNNHLNIKSTFDKKTPIISKKEKLKVGNNDNA